MKTPTAILLLVAASAASGFAGYYFGHQQSADAAAADAKAKRSTAPRTVAISAALAQLENVSLAGLLKGPGTPDPNVLALWAKGLSPAECVEMVKELQAAKGGLVRDTVLEAVLKSWGASDPKGMLGSITDLKSPHLREAGVDAALKSMGAKDPAATLQWLKDNPGTASPAANQARYDAAIAGIAATDPKGAFDTVSALPDGNDRDRQAKSQALNSLTDTMAESGNFTGAQQLLATLPTGTTRDEAFDHFAESIASYSPDDATAWASSLTDPAERQRLEGHVVDSWATSDPLAAATWAAQTDQQALANADPNAPKDPTNAPGMLLANAIVSWAADDIDGPGNFLNQLPASPSKDRSVAVFAMHVGQEDPESAAKWLDTVSDPQIRSGVTMVVAMQMYQQDPAMFTNFMSTNTQMDATQRQQLQQIVPMMSMSMTALKGMTGGGGDPMSNIMENVLTGKSSQLNSMMRNARGARPGSTTVTTVPTGPGQ